MSGTGSSKSKRVASYGGRDNPGAAEPHRHKHTHSNPSGWWCWHLGFMEGFRGGMVSNRREAMARAHVLLALSPSPPPAWHARACCPR